MDEPSGTPAGSALLVVMSSRVLVRVLLSVLAGALCGVVVTCAVVLTAPRERAELDQARAVPPGAGRSGAAREVLRDWDSARTAAWAAGDDDGLARLYTPGSVAGGRDVAMLRAWTARGVRVTELDTQVLRLQVLVERERRLVLVVTDRVALVRAAGVALPDDRPSTRRIVLVRAPAGRAGPGWRVASVSPEPPARS